MAPGTSDPSAGDGPLLVPQDGEHVGSGSLDTQVPEAETGQEVGEPAAGSHKKRRSGRSWLVELVVIVVVVLGASFLVRTFVVQTFYIPSGSMIPTLQVGDRILVDKLSYHLHGVGRGDIVVFSKPPLEQQNINDLVKRVIGLPGETISSVNGEIYINGKLLPEPWLQPGVTIAARSEPGAVQPGQAVQDPSWRVLRDGGQPHRFGRLPMVRPHSQVPDRGQGVHPDLAPLPHRRPLTRRGPNQPLGHAGAADGCDGLRGGCAGTLDARAFP